MNMGFLKLTAIALVAAPFATNAQIETLDYQNANLSGFQQTTYPPPDVGIVPISTNLDVSLVLSSPLGDNLRNVPVIPVSWTTSCYNFSCYFVNSNSPPTATNAASFLFSTNANGAISGWEVLINSSCCSGSANVFLLTLTSGL